MRDLDFISGNFADYHIPRDKQWLLKYFTTDMQVSFLRYYLCFNDARLFCAHTGYFCSDRLRYRLLSRYRRLTKLHEECKQSFSEQGLETLQLLESGEYPLTGGEIP